MKQPNRQKRIYNILSLVALNCILIGAIMFFSINIDWIGPSSEFNHDIINDSNAMGLLFLVTGIPLFFLFRILARRANRQIVDKEE